MSFLCQALQQLERIRVRRNRQRLGTAPAERPRTPWEKLVEFGHQPFRSQPRVKLVGPDGKPVKPGTTPVEPPAAPPTE